jgi:hypothetical protein
MDGGSARRKAPAYTQNKRTHMPASRVGFEPTIPVCEEVHVLDRAATVIDPANTITTNAGRTTSKRPI